MCPFVCAGVAQGQSNCLVSSGSGVQILPPAPAFSRSCQVRPADSGRYPSGQRGQTVNLLAYAFGGSNPPLPTTFDAGAVKNCGNSSAVERQPSKLGVAGSNPVSRSRTWSDTKNSRAHVAQLAEHALGKGEVSGSIPDMGSTSMASEMKATPRASGGCGGVPAP